MTIRFRKMHGAGNDFIMVDGTPLGADLLPGPTIAGLCDRRKGIGADGLIALLPTDGADFRMVYFNADGSEAGMCGNGARCSVAFAHALGWIGSECRFATGAGRLEGRLIATDGATSDVEVSLTGWTDLQLNREVPGSPWGEMHSCNTGVPHLVIPVPDVDDVDLPRYGPELRHHALFGPTGTNVNWISPAGAADPRSGPVYRLRTYERGVEAETLACGTGASAAAVILCHRDGLEGAVAVRTRGGDLLRITVDIATGSLLLRGPAVESFQGEVAYDE